MERLELGTFIVKAGGNAGAWFRGSRCVGSSLGVAPVSCDLAAELPETLMEET